MLWSMQQQTRRTTIALDDDLHRAWKATGLPLAELIRRGIEGTGDNARHVNAEMRLALVEARLSALETRPAAHLAPMLSVGLVEPDEPAESDEDYLARTRAETERRRHERLVAWHDRLWSALRRDPERAAAVTVADVLDLTGVPQSTARTMMHQLVSAGYALQHPRRDGTGDPYRWTVRDPATVDRTAPTSPGTVPDPTANDQGLET